LRLSTLFFVGGMALSAFVVNAWYKPFSAIQSLGITRSGNPGGEPLEFLVSDLLEHALRKNGQTWDKITFRRAVDAVTEVSKRYHYRPAFVLSLIQHESRFDRTAVSSAGAMGLTQLLPATAHFAATNCGLAPPCRQDLFETGTNIRLGFAYFAYLEGLYGTRDAALTAYNGGPEALQRAVEGALPLAGYRTAIYAGERDFTGWLKSPDGGSRTTSVTP
jgi:soluble lytic murein transglycosylase-like protein